METDQRILARYTGDGAYHRTIMFDRPYHGNFLIRAVNPERVFWELMASLEAITTRMRRAPSRPESHRYARQVANYHSRIASHLWSNGAWL